MSNVLQMPPSETELEKLEIMARLHMNVKNLQRFIVRNSVDLFNPTDLTVIEEDKNTLEIIYETIRRK